MPVVDLGTIKKWGVDGDDRELIKLERRAVAILEAETGRLYSGAGNRTVLTNARGGQVVYLGDEPSALVSVRTRASVGADWTTETLSDFSVSGTRVFRVDGGYFPDGDATLELVYTRGSATPSDHLKQAVLSLVADLWNKRGQSLASADINTEQGAPETSRYPHDVYRFIVRERGLGMY